MKLNQLLIAGTAAALLPFAGAFAQSPSPEPSTVPAESPAVQSQQQGATFDSLDTDKDGRISKSEAEANANVSAQFAQYDKNGNGFIERDEVNSANKK